MRIIDSSVESGRVRAIRVPNAAGWSSKPSQCVLDEVKKPEEPSRIEATVGKRTNCPRRGTSRPPPCSVLKPSRNLQLLLNAPQQHCEELIAILITGRGESYNFITLLP